MKRYLYVESKYHFGLLLLRLGIGLSFIAHGYPKVFEGGAYGLAKGLAAAGIPGGIYGAYLAGGVEFLGGIALVIGLLTRPAALLMAFTMIVALIFHLNLGHEFTKYSHALEVAIVFIVIMVTGAGRFSIDKGLFGK